MAKCNQCGKTTTFGHNRSHSLVATKREFRPNLQRITLTQGNKRVRRVLCTRCIKTLTKAYK